MTIVHDFEYVRPKSINNIVEVLQKNSDYLILAGGTDAVGNLKDGSITPKVVVDIKGVKSLKQITFDGKVLQIGSLATFSELMESSVVLENYPVIMETAITVASPGIRNRATMVGNICSAVPCADSAPLLTALEAELFLFGDKGERKIPIAKWFKGSRSTALRDGEFVTSVAIPLPAEQYAGSFVKLRRYQGEDLAQANVCTLVLPDNQYRVVFGSVGPVPIRAKKVESVLNGKEITDSLLNEAKELIAEEITPITDIRASKEYRLHMCEVMFERAIKASMDRFKGNGPKYGTSLI